MSEEPDYIKAHKASSPHRAELLSRDWCGCFHCLKVFKPIEIQRWVDKSATALCPYCGIDSVIGAESGFPIESELLKKMQLHWFADAAPDEKELLLYQKPTKDIPDLFK
jgi:hypothetical protein